MEPDRSEGKKIILIEYSYIKNLFQAIERGFVLGNEIVFEFKK